MINEEAKKEIDNMQIEQMLRKWRFAPEGALMFAGEQGEYFEKVMNTKREEISPQAWTAISKAIGWNQ